MALKPYIRRRIYRHLRQEWALRHALSLLNRFFRDTWNRIYYYIMMD